MTAAGSDPSPRTSAPRRRGPGHASPMGRQTRVARYQVRVADRDVRVLLRCCSVVSGPARPGVLGSRLRGNDGCGGVMLATGVTPAEAGPRSPLHDGPAAVKRERPNPRGRAIGDNSLHPGSTRGALSRRACRWCEPGAARLVAPVARATPGKNDRDGDGLTVRRARRAALQRWSADAAFPLHEPGVRAPLPSPDDPPSATRVGRNVLGASAVAPVESTPAARCPDSRLHLRGMTCEFAGARVHAEAASMANAELYFRHPSAGNRPSTG